MPTINIPPVVRFALYLIGAISLLTVSYAVDKSWAGDAEVRYVTGLAALLQLLAAAKTNMRDEPKVIKDGTVKVVSGESADGEGGHGDVTLIIAALALALSVAAICGFRL